MDIKSESKQKSNKDFDLKGTMELKTIVQTTITEYSILKWFVEDYERFLLGTLYFQLFENSGFKCVLKIAKSVAGLNVALRIWYTNADVSVYLDNGNPASKFVRASEISDGFYAAMIPQDFVRHEMGSHMNENVLKLVFRFKVGCRVQRKDNPYGEIGVLSDVDFLGSQAKRIYLLAHESDFSFKVFDTSLKAHKCILSARSTFFEEYFRKYRKAKEFAIPETSPGIMHEVLVYMYSGELSKMNANCMVKVFEIAFLLKIQSLKDRCCKFFEETSSWHALRGIRFDEYEIE